jgi:endonuclease YncB( thermonuclease family)
MRISTKTLVATLLATSVASFFCMASNIDDKIEGRRDKPSSYLHIDGVRTKVFFNDGDTFKILEGDYEKISARIAGFNTLENYGPVHEWMGMSVEDLYGVSQDATKWARSGTWHCESMDEEDSYGRLLVVCDDLAVSLIAEGLAHAYSIDSDPAPKSYIKAQQVAQELALGMWAQGVPQYIITSLHSASERGNQHYNRVIATDDGSTKEWQHNEHYDTCERVCYQPNTCMIYVPFGNRYGNGRAECLFLEGLSNKIGGLNGQSVGPAAGG